MGGRIIGTIDWLSTFNPQKDGNDLCVEIRNACSMPFAGLTVFFLAEKHRDPFDVKRSEIVFEEFSKRQYEKRLCLVVERRLFEGVDLPHLVYEGITELSSRDHKRNVRIVSLLKEYREQTPAPVGVSTRM